MRMIDLCCGIGGIRKGFELAGGFENVLSAEIDKYACLTYKHLFGDDASNDITNEDFKRLVYQTEYDVLLAGFPCQTFSRAGLQAGFRDTTKGTIFFEIAEIIEQTMPKIVFLENVENLVSHDNGRTFKIILNTLEKELNYHVVGVNHKDLDDLKFEKSAFIRNTKYFGLPQNRPRVYIVAFSRAYFGDHLNQIPNELPITGDKIIFKSVRDILDKDVSERYFLSSGYLETLENHKARQKCNGNGFGYRIVNETNTINPIASTILATGGSGRERNLIYDYNNGNKYKNMVVPGKRTPVNSKYIRSMTPTEWGRLQGFIGYAFLDENGNDTFSFPSCISDQQKYKQFGNSVSIPVIEALASFIKKCVDDMVTNFSCQEKENYGIPGAVLRMCMKIQAELKESSSSNIIQECCQLVTKIGTSHDFSINDVSTILCGSTKDAYDYIHKLQCIDCIRQDDKGYKLEIQRKSFKESVY